ncbi:hypothetical protein HanXRQr2_Chr14g0652141 [Helianthus annuus]|uniref:Uncharacterized protein n=1 Tax=Helianthus annuus TaxID=4232 RepID=A0A9K3EC56_HELAN|nr:hypothetical protein HanXRQr2_Chr14g0652141 [Helianthus annuus]KAJ0840995.1 hypothetical protein HanPSC8_Chr14g0625361 [Helianthus annuus]
MRSTLDHHISCTCLMSCIYRRMSEGSIAEIDTNNGNELNVLSRQNRDFTVKL